MAKPQVIKDLGACSPHSKYNFHNLNSIEPNPGSETIRLSARAMRKQGKEVLGFCKKDGSTYLEVKPPAIQNRLQTNPQSGKPTIEQYIDQIATVKGDKSKLAKEIQEAELALEQIEASTKIIKSLKPESFSIEEALIGAGLAGLSTLLFTGTGTFGVLTHAAGDAITRITTSGNYGLAFQWEKFCALKNKVSQARCKGFWASEGLNVAKRLGIPAVSYAAFLMLSGYATIKGIGYLFRKDPFDAGALAPSTATSTTTASSATAGTTSSTVSIPLAVTGTTAEAKKIEEQVRAKYAKYYTMGVDALEDEFSQMAWDKMDSAIKLEILNVRISAAISRAKDIAFIASRAKLENAEKYSSEELATIKERVKALELEAVKASATDEVVQYLIYGLGGLAGLAVGFSSGQKAGAKAWGTTQFAHEVADRRKEMEQAAQVAAEKEWRDLQPKLQCGDSQKPSQRAAGGKLIPESKLFPVMDRRPKETRDTPTVQERQASSTLVVPVVTRSVPFGLRPAPQLVPALEGPAYQPAVFRSFWEPLPEQGSLSGSGRGSGGIKSAPPSLGIPRLSTNLFNTALGAASSTAGSVGMALAADALLNPNPDWKQNVKDYSASAGMGMGAGLLMDGLGNLMDGRSFLQPTTAWEVPATSLHGVLRTSLVWAVATGTLEYRRTGKVNAPALALNTGIGTMAQTAVQSGHIALQASRNMSFLTSLQGAQLAEANGAIAALEEMKLVQNTASGGLSINLSKGAIQAAEARGTISAAQATRLIAAADTLQAMGFRSAVATGGALLVQAALILLVSAVAGWMIKNIVLTFAEDKCRDKLILAIMALNDLLARVPRPTELLAGARAEVEEAYSEYQGFIQAKETIDLASTMQEWGAKRKDLTEEYMDKVYGSSRKGSISGAKEEFYYENELMCALDRWWEDDRSAPLEAYDACRNDPVKNGDKEDYQLRSEQQKLDRKYRARAERLSGEANERLTRQYPDWKPIPDANPQEQSPSSSYVERRVYPPEELARMKALNPDLDQKTLVALSQLKVPVPNLELQRILARNLADLGLQMHEYLERSKR